MREKRYLNNRREDNNMNIIKINVCANGKVRQGIVFARWFIKHNVMATNTVAVFLSVCFCGDIHGIYL